MKAVFFRKLFLILVLLSACVIVSAQTAALPDGYLTVKLGMSLNQVKSALLSESSFGYRGDRDVSFLPDGDRNLIETKGSGFLSDCWFQFSNDSLYTITINLNTSEMDYYSVFKTLCEKYGNPGELTPQKCIWQDSRVIMTLEKPLCIKYSDAAVLQQFSDDVKVEEASAEVRRQNFLDSL